MKLRRIWLASLLYQYLERLILAIDAVKGQFHQRYRQSARDAEFRQSKYAAARLERSWRSSRDGKPSHSKIPKTSRPPFPSRPSR